MSGVSVSGMTEWCVSATVSGLSVCVCVTGSDVSVSVAVSGVILGGMTEWCESVGR